jgi:hypothetical protein
MEMVMNILIISRAFFKFLFIYWYKKKDRGLRLDRCDRPTTVGSLLIPFHLKIVEERISETLWGLYSPRNCKGKGKGKGKQPLPVSVHPLRYAIWTMEIFLKAWNFHLGHVYWSTDRQTDGNWMNTAQYCPQTIYCFQNFTIKSHITGITQPCNIKITLEVILNGINFCSTFFTVKGNLTGTKGHKNTYL